MYSYVSLVFAIILTFLSLVTRSPSMYSYISLVFVIILTFLSLFTLRVTRKRKVRIMANTNDTYEYIEGATSNQRKKGTNYTKYQ
jgi:uncharacterized protein YacL